MSTSHYSKPSFRGLQPLPNRRKWTLGKLSIIGGLLIIDLLTLIGSKDLTESLILVGLVLVNLWALTYTRP